jgi:1-hydroxycarotenoid 3,4-desaturase
VLARHAWSRGAHLDLFQDHQRSVDAIGDFAGPAEARRYSLFCQHAERVFRTLESTFIRDQRPSMVELILRGGLRGLPGMMTMKPFSSMWRELTRQLKDPRLQQLFGRYATYCGSSPFQASAVLLLIAHVEQRGVWSVDGGMQQLAAGCARLASELGCQIHTDTKVTELELHNGQVSGVVTDNHEHHRASAVIFNGDPSALASGLLGHPVSGATARVTPPQRSLSALTFSFFGSISGFTPDRHNVFFSPDYKREFTELFKRGQLPSNPTVYLCAQYRGAPAQNHHGLTPEPLFCLVNAPATADITDLTDQQIRQCQTSAFDRMQQCGLEIQTLSEPPVVTSPSDFQALFPGSGGALYGQASHHWKASFSRPDSRTSIPGLYLAGGATHPGPGVPMASLSGQLAAQSLLKDQGLNST